MTDDRPGLAEALTRIELREAALLSWGAVDASFTRPEVLAIIGEQSPAELDPAEVLDRLTELALVMRTPEGLFRSRMAETIRLLATLRQTFRNHQWWEGAPLVLDHRFLHRPRLRPGRHPADVFRAELATLMSPAARRVADRLLPVEVSGFQEQSAHSILRALQASTDRGVMVTAGTGAGKSLAFYLPALSWIGETIAGDPAHGVRCVAIYPRNELLKDQLATLLGHVRQLREAAATTRPIVIGTWFGATPDSARVVREGQSPEWREWRAGGRRIGWHCPFLDCPGCGAPMIWPAAAIRDEQEELRCTAEDCGLVIGPDMLNLTRQRAVQRPADVILTTTESINRQLAAPHRHAAFGIRGRRARLILLDEVHIYEGTTGAQNALLLRRFRHAIGQPVTWVGLSATLLNAERFLEQLTGLPEGTVSVARPKPAEMVETGAEYLVALRHDPAWRTGPLSTSIQAAMLMPRCLDRNPEAARYRPLPSSDGLFGSRTFAFTDKLDVTNRLYWNLLDAEGWQSPGRPKGMRPLTLAHLRAADQLRRREADREDSTDREPVGQWWWLPEELGWNLDDDVQLTVGRTSSQDTGVSEQADLIVATATLEVGYDDNRVGAILQHKAPHDAAQFLQRRGRAGRNALMRPWTVVVLSGWGRDKRAWQLYEDLLEPELRARSLPLGNRYVLRMQAVYALLDWLGGQLAQTGSNPWAWRDLTAPADIIERTPPQRDSRLTRQQAAADLLEAVLAGGMARESLRNHLRKALKLGRDDGAVLDALLWEPPRSLLLAVIPTMARRLRSQWAGEVPDPEDLRVRTVTPLREFVAGNLFDDLLVPEVRVLLRSPAGRRAGPGGRNPAPEEDLLPAMRTIRELMPGNVTRHFGIRSWERRHWLAPPQPLAQAPHQDVDLTHAYGGVLTARFADPRDPVREVFLYRPQAVTLEGPDPEVRDATTAAPHWGVHLRALGNGRAARLARSRWQEVITQITFHTHGTGGGVRVRRYATGASGSLFEDRDPVPFEISFSTPDLPAAAVAALGIEMDADGMCLIIGQPREFPPPTAEERSARLRWLLTDNPALPAGLSRFERMSLVLGVQMAIAGHSQDQPGTALTGLSDGELTAVLMDALTQVSVIRPQQGPQQANSPAIAGWCSVPAVLTAVRAAIAAAYDVRDPAWREWLQHRFAATAGALFVDAVAAACPDVDTQELVMDIEPQEAGQQDSLQVWLTELAPGGAGQIERVHAALAQDPGRFARILTAAAEPGDVEQLDQVTRAFLDAVLTDAATGQAAARLRMAWTAGHEAVSAALADLRAATSAAGLELSRLAWTTISSRLLGPGAHPDLPTALVGWLRRWDEAEERAQLALDPQVVGSLVADHEDVTAVLNLPATASRHRRSLAVASVFWPRSGSAWLDSGGSATTFGTDPDPDVALVRGVLGPPPAALRITTWDEQARQNLHAALLRDAAAVLVFPAANASQARRAIVASQAEPVDMGGMLGYPDVVGVRQADGHLWVTLTLTEALA